MYLAQANRLHQIRRTMEISASLLHPGKQASFKLPRGSVPRASQNLDKAIVTKITVTPVNTHYGGKREPLQAFHSYLILSSSFLKYWVTFLKQQKSGFR